MNYQSYLEDAVFTQSKFFFIEDYLNPLLVPLYNRIDWEILELSYLDDDLFFEKYFSSFLYSKPQHEVFGEFTFQIIFRSFQ